MLHIKLINVSERDMCQHCSMKLGFLLSKPNLMVSALQRLGEAAAFLHLGMSRH